jgi:hypothetical protein
LKAVEKQEVGGKGVRESIPRHWTDQSKPHPQWAYIETPLWDTPLNINSNINYENQDCKTGSVGCGGILMGGEGWKKETKVMVYDWWTSYTYETELKNLLQLL